MKKDLFVEWAALIAVSGRCGYSGMAGAFNNDQNRNDFCY